MTLTVMDARSAVLEQLAAAQQHFDDDERMSRLAGDVVAAEGAHRHMLWLFRAYLAEFDDKQPPPPILAACGACRVDVCDGCHFCRVKVLLS
jgi:hypothetical protein